MKVAILGRTKLLLETAKQLVENGYEIGIVGTCRSEGYYDVKEKDFEEFAKSVSADFFISNSLNTPEIVERLKKANCAVAISVNWLTIVREEACAAFKHGVLNAHAGDLPRYRGNACPNWAIINGEDKIGLCVHEMESGSLDSGDVYVRRYFDLDQGTYIQDVYDWLEEAIPSAFAEAVDLIEKGEKPVPQSKNPKDALRCYPRCESDARIDWSQSAETILRLIRASSKPFSGAFTFLEDEHKVIIWRARIYQHEGPFCAVPGQILSIEENCVVVACGGQALLLEDIDVPGQAPESAARFVAKSLRNRLT